MTSSKKKKLFIFTSIIFIIIASFFFLELLAIIFVKDPEIDDISTSCTIEANSPYIKENQCFRSQDEMAKMEYNTFVGYIPAANYSGIGWYTNNEHFRYNEDFNKEKPKDEIRIFISGGSTAWGAGVTQDQTFAFLLEKKLNSLQSKKKIRVIIAAAGGWASSQERAFIFSYVKEFDPDIVLMFSGWNDIYHAYTGRDYNKNQDFLLYRKAIYTSQELLKPHARLSERYKDKFESLCPPRYSESTSKFLYLIASIIYKFSYDKNILFEKIKDIEFDSNKIKENTLDNIDYVNYLSKKQGFHLIYCLQPTIYFTQKKFSNWEKNIVRMSEESDVGYAEYNSKSYKMLKNVIKIDALEKGYLFLDADDAISQEIESVFTDHVHFGDRGNILIAEYLFNQLIKLDIIQ